MLKNLGIVQFYNAFRCAIVLTLVALVSFSAGGFAEDQEQSKAKPAGVKRRVGIVRHVGESSRGPFVVIDSGQLRGYVIGVDVCFYDVHSDAASRNFSDLSFG